MTTRERKEDGVAQEQPAWLVALSQRLDDFLRFLDLRLRRTAGGWIDRRFAISRHTVAALWLPSVLCGLLVLGSPALARIGIAAAVALLVGAVLVWQMRHASGKRQPVFVDLLWQGAMVLAVAAVVWFSGPNSYTTAQPYRHALIPLAVATALALVAGAVLLGPIFRWPLECSQYGEYLPKTELFLSRGKTPPFSAATFLGGVAASVVHAPLALLTLPAIATLLAPPVWIPLVPIITAAVSVVALLLAGLNDRFAAMWILFQQSLLSGGALLVSIVVVVLAVLRLWPVTYVTTIFDSAAWWTITTVFVSAYVLSWWFDYWSQRMLTDCMLRLIDKDAVGVAQIPYPIAQNAARTSVPWNERVLQVHGAGRFIAFRAKGANDDLPRFQAHTPMQLIELLANTGAPGGKAEPKPGQIAARMASYQVVLGLVFVVIVGFGMWQLHRGIQSAEVTLQLAGQGGVPLQDLLVPNTPDPKDRPVILVAASGGGTRAAVYTAAVLEGIAQRGAVDRVVLGSGVSGGGAALAYFAGHRKALVAGKPEEWRQYFDTMTQPFIQDVLQRASEWRMVSSGRLGMALAESFEQRWALPSDRTKLVDVKDMGLILNTALAGHFERPQDATAGRALQDVERDYRDRTTSTLAGGRLLLTNLALPSPLAKPSIDPDPRLARLPVVIRSDQLRLEAAAALNANFPPVFSNAAVDVDDNTRYWVTDGGAVDNRGMETLLYAVREALRPVKDENLPRLHIVVADASAFSSSYSQDRGVSTMAGAGSRYASHLNAELVEAIREKYAKVADRFTFSYVMLPDILRRSGSFGTHWMLQDRIEVQFEGDKAVVSGTEMVRVIRAMHSGDTSQLGAAGCRVLAWSQQDVGHREGWNAVLKALGGSGKVPACGAKAG